MTLSRYHIVSMILMTPLLLVSGGRELRAQTVLTAAEDSRVWIEGRSNVNQFECNASRYDGEAVLNDSLANNASSPENVYRKFSADTGRSAGANELGQATGNTVTLRMEIPVEGFECGRNRMNRDLNDALRSDEHPLITFHLHEVNTLPYDEDEEKRYRIDIEGTLTVAGTTRNVELTATGEILEDGRLRARGQKTILMTDYNVTPPSGLFGLIQADNELTVHFDLYTAAAQEQP